MAISFYGKIASEHELAAVSDCLLQGVFHSDGGYSARLRELFRTHLHAEEVLFTPSCSHALELSCHLLNLQRDDEVILPSYNFPSAANAVLLAGGKPVLCDIDPDTQTLSIKDVENRITRRTRAVIAVHYASISCDMDALTRLSVSAGFSLIEDAATAVCAQYKGLFLGTIGRFGAFSFHSTKNFSCGEGGVLFLRADDLAQAEIFRDKGTNRRQFMRGECDQYAWVSKGSSLVISELLAAMLLPQLESRAETTAKRMAVHNTYVDALQTLSHRGSIRMMAVPTYARPNGHLFYVRFANAALRDRAMNSLLCAGIDARTHFVPLHLSPMGKSLGYRADDLPESRATSETLLRLPIHPLMTQDDALIVAHTLTKAVGG